MLKQFYLHSILNKPFVCTQFKCQTTLFGPRIGPFQVQPLQPLVALGVMAMKGYTAFPKALALMESQH